MNEELQKINERVMKEMHIQNLKDQLSALDYKSIKYIQGCLSEEEFAETKQKCAEIRQQINELEKLL